jgi:predicted PurR-regulated permease PerM
MVQSRTAFLPPPLLLATQLFLAVVLGFYGLLLAAPLCALGLVLVQLLYLEDHLGEPVEIPGYSSRYRTAESGMESEEVAEQAWQM